MGAHPHGPLKIIQARRKYPVSRGRFIAVDFPLSPFRGNNEPAQVALFSQTGPMLFAAPLQGVRLVSIFSWSQRIKGDPQGVNFFPHA